MRCELRRGLLPPSIPDRLASSSHKLREDAALSAAEVHLHTRQQRYFVPSLCLTCSCTIAVVSRCTSDPGGGITPGVSLPLFLVSVVIPEGAGIPSVTVEAKDGVVRTGTRAPSPGKLATTRCLAPGKFQLRSVRVGSSAHLGGISPWGRIALVAARRSIAIAYLEAMPASFTSVASEVLLRECLVPGLGANLSGPSDAC